MLRVLNSTLFRFFVPLFLITAISIFIGISITTQKAKNILYQLKQQESLAVLKNVEGIIGEYQRSINSYKEEAIENRKKELLHITEIAFHILEHYYDLYKQGKLSEEKAKKLAKQTITLMRYGNGDYVWGINKDYVLIIHPDKRLLGKNNYNLKDPDGVYVIRELVERAINAGYKKPVYVFYRWWRYDEGNKIKEPQPKLSVSMYFKPWDWILGTGVYIQDIEKQVQKKKKEAIQKLRDRLSNLRIGDGYVFVFDEKGNMIYHPTIMDINIIEKQMKDPQTGKLMYDELTEVAKKPWGKNYLEYLWDKPDDKGNYIYPKIAWVVQEPLTGWYINISAYKEEIERPAKILKESLIIPSIAIIGVIFLALLILLRKLLYPVKQMVEVFEHIEKGDFSVKAPEDAPAEMGFLAREFNKMIEALKTYQEKLEDKVKERTKELLQKTKELEEANERLKELDKAKSAFLSSVSHELRTPLTSILGFAKLIEKDFKKHFKPLVEDDKKLKKKSDRIIENLEVIVKEGERLTRLINDVLDIAKIESGKIQWKDSQFNLKELLDEVVASVSGQFSQKENVELIVELPEKLPDLYMDKDRLHQVFLNLLNNSAKFTEKGHVKLYAYEKDNSVVVAVEDTGIGIPKENLDKIFDKFHQVVHDDTLKDKPQGTGLGLAISKQIVEHYNGKIWAVSELGKGSTFFVELPINTKENLSNKENQEKTKKEEKVEEKSLDKSKKLILVVDDEKDIQNLLSQLLTDLGFEVITASNGKEAIEKAKEYKPHLITMDLMMPVMDGKTAIKLIKEDESLKNIPILVISVLPEVKGIADAYIEKPIDENHLKEVIMSMLKKGEKYTKKCLIVSDDKEKADYIKEEIIRCPESVIYCSVDELENILNDDFKGIIVIPNDVSSKLNIESLSKKEGIQIIIT